MSDLETRLRATMAEHAQHAPAGGQLAERIIDEVHAPAVVLRPRHGWRTWSLPLLAAGAVAAVVATVVGIQHSGTTAAPPPPAMSHVLTPSPSPSPSPSTARPTKGRQIAPAPGARTVHATSPASVGVNGFMALSTTFISADEGWAFGSAQCLDPTAQNSPGNRCTAMLHTADGGVTWHSVPNPPGNTPNLGCASPCIQSIRFANTQIGYAFSATALEMTVNGGKTWTRATGGATALETLAGNVIRVEQVPGCHRALCQERVLTAAIGSSKWTVVDDLPALVNEVGEDQQAELVRVGDRAAILTWADVRSNGQIAGRSSALYLSGDDGRSWSAPSDPCSALGALSASAVDLAPDGSTHLLCSDQAESDPRNVVMTSSDNGKHYTASPQLPIDPYTGMLSAASARVLFVPTIRGLERSTDGGSTWQLVIKDATDSYGPPGFESGQVGRWLSRAGLRIWTTHDAGRTWTPFDFS